MRNLFTSQAWLYCVADAMAGGEAWIFPVREKLPAGTQHLVVGSIIEGKGGKSGRGLFMISAYNKNIACHGEETVRFRVPASLFAPGGRRAQRRVQFVRLTRQSAVHDRIRADLLAAGLLKPEFAQRPDRLGSVREMGAGRKGEILVDQQWDKYTRLWEESLTLKPLEGAVGEMAAGEEGLTFSVRLAPPEILVLSVQ
jgi:hypothetical protein